MALKFTRIVTEDVIPTKVSQLENDSGYISSTQATQPTWNGKELLIMDDLYTRKEIANIPDGSDLNTVKYLAPGIYTSNGTNVANRAGTGPFIMEVFSYGLPPNDDEVSETWVYRLRKLTDLQGNSYVQSCNSGGAPGVFVYGEWRSETSGGSGGSDWSFEELRINSENLQELLEEGEGNLILHSNTVIYTEGINEGFSIHLNGYKCIFMEVHVDSMAFYTNEDPDNYTPVVIKHDTDTPMLDGYDSTYLILMDFDVNYLLVYYENGVWHIEHALYGEM